MIPHDANGQYDCCTVQCIEREEEFDKFRIEHKNGTTGVLTIFIEDGEFDGWDWKGDPGSGLLMVECEQATKEMQEVLDCFDGHYEN